VSKSALIAPLASAAFLEGVARLRLGSQISLVALAMLESAFISILALAFSPVQALLGSSGATTRSTRATSTPGSTGFLLSTLLGFGVGVRSTVAVSALVTKAALGLLGEIAANFYTVLVVLGSLGLGLLLFASATRATATTSACSGLLASGLALRLGALVLVVALHVLVAALVAETARTLLQVLAANLLLAILSLRAVGGALVVVAMDKTAAVTEAAALVLSPVLAVAFGLVVARWDSDGFARRVLVFAVIAKAAFSLVVAE